MLPQTVHPKRPVATGHATGPGGLVQGTGDTVLEALAAPVCAARGQGTVPSSGTDSQAVSNTHPTRIARDRHAGPRAPWRPLCSTAGSVGNWVGGAPRLRGRGHPISVVEQRWAWLFPEWACLWLAWAWPIIPLAGRRYAFASLVSFQLGVARPWVGGAMPCVGVATTLVSWLCLLRTRFCTGWWAWPIRLTGVAMPFVGVAKH